MRRWLLLVCCGAIVSGCSVYSVKQSSLVPVAVLPPPPGERTTGDFYLGDDTLTFLQQPELAPNEDAGLWIPRTQFDGAVSVRPIPRLGLRFLWLAAPAGGAQKAAPTTLADPGGSTGGPGLGVSTRIGPLVGPWSFDIAGDFLVVSVPSRLWAACVENCPPGETIHTWKEHDMVAIYSLATFMTWRVSQAGRLMFSAALRNHPTNVANFETVLPASSVHAGPLNLLLGLGGEIQLGSGFSLVPQVHVPVLARPVRYGPIIAVGLRYSFGRDFSRPLVVQEYGPSYGSPVAVRPSYGPPPPVGQPAFPTPSAYPP